jgi:glycosyltransferase involved in cell wall biosynthesis
MLTRSIGGSFSFFSGLMCADVVLAQTENIAKAFKRALGPQKNIIVVPQIHSDDFHRTKSPRDGFVLWVSRLIWYKQPLVFIEAASRLKDIQFVMVGSGPLEPLVKERAQSVTNLRYLGPKTHEEVEKLCSKAAVFANTSTFEGFPNTFLECASKSTPIVTLFYDPDEVICKFQMGMHSRTFDQFVKDLRGLTEDDETRRRMGANARQYVKRHNSPETVINIYKQLLDSF